MALITCPECNNKISQYASNCVHCGWPVEEWIIYPNDIHEKENEEVKDTKETDEEEGATDKLAALVTDFVKEYGGLISNILTQREVMKLYVENDFDDEDLEEKAEAALKDKILKQCLSETQKILDYILRRLIKLNIIKDSGDEPHLTDDEQCIVNIWKENGMVLTYNDDKLGLMSLESYMILFQKKYEEKELSTTEQAVLLKTYLDVHHVKILKQLGFSKEAINEMLEVWKKNM